MSNENKLTDRVNLRIPTDAWEKLNTTNMVSRLGGRSAFLRICTDIATKKANTAYDYHRQKIGGFTMPAADASPSNVRQWAMLVMFLRATPMQQAETLAVRTVVEVMQTLASQGGLDDEEL